MDKNLEKFKKKIGYLVTALFLGYMLIIDFFISFIIGIILGILLINFWRYLG